ncbi:coiled-coil domain-containing protein R3HCC1L [Trichonephila inaurata madagascariensis]|uniref:Coiled-coil domain-containing protein R3HCC1L n=1 Tax=Trichonephila inaurata madagascariensis TaxID=2747483 RepID=A0A8X6YUE9_9ARAC|nr:coiled-coil domain-containing protein R3HCC1L [Trichonephila inaurata madagascariensis]
MKDFKVGRGKCSVASLEKKHAGGNQANLKEKQKRPDKQLYVPRALRGVESKVISLNEVKTGNLGRKNSKTSTEHSTKVTDITCSSSSSASDSSSKVILRSNCMSKSEDSENAIDSSAVITSSSSEAIRNCASQNTLTSSASSVLSESVDQINIQGNYLCVSSQTLVLGNNHNENYALPISASSIISQKVSEWKKECCILEDISTDSVESIKEEIESASCYTSDFKGNETSCLVLHVSNDSLDCKNKEHDGENVIDISSTSNIDKSLKMNEQLHASTSSSVLDDSLEMVKHLEASANSNILGNSLDKHLDASATTSDIVDKSEEVSEKLQTSTNSDLLAEKTEDSWESMFDDDGECLNSDFVKELNIVTGQIKIHTSKSNYSEYQPVSDNVPEEYENIVELYNFPKEFSTQDLVSALSMFQQSCYCIKWVDDCHALAVFTSPSIANQALLLTHPFVKVRPLSEGLKESKAKARWCARHSEPPKPRPATTAALARRLVSGALGLKLQATKEQKELERNMLKNAREKRRQKAKQQQAIWEGVTM